MPGPEPDPGGTAGTGASGAAGAAKKAVQSGAAKVANASSAFPVIGVIVGIPIVLIAANTRIGPFVVLTLVAVLVAVVLAPGSNPAPAKGG